MKKVLYIVLAASFILGLVACGGQENDQNLGIWVATTAELMGIETDVGGLFGNGFTIELKAGGKCTIIVDEENGSGTWTLKNGAFTAKAGQMKYEGRLEDGKLTLENVMSLGITLTFYKDSKNP